MNLSLIIPTHQRAVAIGKLLNSIERQTVVPSRILIVDSSDNDETKEWIDKNKFHLPLIYVKVSGENKGSAQQRNFGSELVRDSSDIITFLDDDLILEPDFFENLLETYKIYPDAVGVGGIDIKNNYYFKKESNKRYSKYRHYEFDGWIRPEPWRNRARRILGLMPHTPPGLIPSYSHGRMALPPSGKIYNVEHFMGGIASFRSGLFDLIKFSNFFKGYGLYEDFDFCVRALKYGRLYVNTNAKVWHYHEPSGRPDFYKYGKMVVRNGWYVWRVRFPDPSIKAQLKWHVTTLLLATIRFLNVISGPNRKNAMHDFAGRVVAWFGVVVNPPPRIY